MKSGLSAKGLAESIALLAGAATITSFLGSWHWLLDLTSHFRLQYALVLLSATALLLAYRSRTHAAAAAFLALVNVAVVLSSAWQPSSPQEQKQIILRLLVANVHTSNPDRQNIQRLIKDKNPDIVVLAEIDDSWVADLAPLNEHYPYGVREPRSDNFGIGLWSRLSLASPQSLNLGPDELSTIKATILLPSGEIDLWATHPLPPSSRENTSSRNAQLEDIRKAIQENRRSALLVGDLNTTPWNHAFRTLIKHGLRSGGGGFDATWPSWAGVFGIPLDHCLHTRDLRVQKFEVGPSIGSDHRPIYVEVSRPGGPN